MNEVFKKAFLSATSYLPDTVWKAAFSLSQAQQEGCEEIRLRIGQVSKAYTLGKYITLTYKGSAHIVTSGDIEWLIQRATKGSIHTYSEQIKNGFITTDEGHRIGITGEIILNNGLVQTIRNVSSINIRIAKPCYGIADKVLKNIYCKGLYNTLIISSPGKGKTSLLRDIARILSKNMAVSVVDERYEIAGIRSNNWGFDIGDCDVISGGNKACDIEIMMRTMSPRIIIIDEITKEEDANVISSMAHSGCVFIATAHCNEITDLTKRIIYKRLIDENVFQRIVKIDSINGDRVYTVFSAEDINDTENIGFNYDSRIMLGNRFFYEQKL